MADTHKRKKKTQPETDEVAVPDIRSNEIKLYDKIGGGCFGDVYKGMCRGKIVAVKQLHQQELEEKTLQEFKKEVAILTHLRHPNVVLFMGACTEPGHLTIVTEFMPNGDLDNLIRNPNMKLTPVKLLEMARQVSQAMTWLHCSNPPIIHRDLKPSNILVDENMNVKVCDFGLSAFQKTKTLQDKGVAPGTPLWMSPEVLQGKPLSEKVDVYSFAMLLWEMFTGKEPFEEYDSYDVFVEAVCFRDERPEFPENFPNCIKSLVCDCWSVVVDNRPSFSQIIERINDALVDVSIVNDATAAKMWKENWPGELSVNWVKFITVFYKTLGIQMPREPEKDNTYKCLKFILISNEESGNTVTLERFGNVLKWFGPLQSAFGNIAVRLVTLMQNKWFHGDLSREKAELQLSGSEKGTFLVRVSSTEPIERAPFTISKMTKSGEINHQRIYVTPVYEGYFTHVKYKSGTKKIEVSGGMENLINTVKKDLSLRKECPGWPYITLFSSVSAEYQRDDDVASSSESDSE